MTELHDELAAWIGAGATGDLSRDVAVHASACAECRALVAAIDLLSDVDLGAAAFPPLQVGATSQRSLSGTARILIGTATLGLLAASVLVASGFLTSLETGGVLPTASATPGEGVLGGEGGPPSVSASADATSSPSMSTEGSPSPSPTSTPLAGVPPPIGTAAPTATARPPFPTPTNRPPTPMPTPVPTPPPTPTPTATPTPTPTPTPALPACSNLIDDDVDGKTDWPEDPGCTDPLDNDETDPDIGT